MVRDTVYEHIKSVADQQRKPLVPLHDDLILLESGMDSLCVAILIASLDDELNVAPFDTSGIIPVTVGELVRMYEHALT